MPKFTFEERNSIKNIVAISSLKRILDKEIINEVQKLTGEHISRQYLFRINEPNFLSSQNMASKPGGAWVIRVSLNLKLGLTRSSKHGLHTNTFRFYDDIMIWLCPSQYISSIQNEGTKNMCGCKDIITISSQPAYCFSKVILLLKLCSYLLML